MQQNLNPTTYLMKRTGSKYPAIHSSMLPEHTFWVGPSGYQIGRSSLNNIGGSGVSIVYYSIGQKFKEAFLCSSTFYNMLSLMYSRKAIYNCSVHLQFPFSRFPYHSPAILCYFSYYVLNLQHAHRYNNGSTTLISTCSSLTPRIPTVSSAHPAGVI